MMISNWKNPFSLRGLHDLFQRFNNVIIFNVFWKSAMWGIYATLEFNPQSWPYSAIIFLCFNDLI